MKNNVTTSYLGNLNFFNRSGNSSSLIRSYHKESIKHIQSIKIVKNKKLYLMIIKKKMNHK